jgi:glucose dehydrogenase
VLKKYFDWTPRDVAQWEAIRKKGFWRFTLWYGLLSGGIIFIIPGAAVLFGWVKSLLSEQAAPASASSLALKLLAIAVICVLAGTINALATWVMEEKIYQQKYKPPEEKPGNRNI